MVSIHSANNKHPHHPETEHGPQHTYIDMYHYISCCAWNVDYKGLGGWVFAIGGKGLPGDAWTLMARDARTSSQPKSLT